MGRRALASSLRCPPECRCPYNPLSPYPPEALGGGQTHSANQPSKEACQRHPSTWKMMCSPAGPTPSVPEGPAQQTTLLILTYTIILLYPSPAPSSISRSRMGRGFTPQSVPSQVDQGRVGWGGRVLDPWIPESRGVGVEVAPSNPTQEFFSGSFFLKPFFLDPFF